MDNLFAQKFLIGDPLNDGQGGSPYDGSGINPNPQGDVSVSTGSGSAINVNNVTATEKAGDMAQSDPNYTPDPEEGGDSENDVTGAIPYLALGLIAAFLFIKFGKK